MPKNKIYPILQGLLISITTFVIMLLLSETVLRVMLKDHKLYMRTNPREKRAIEVLGYAFDEDLGWVMTPRPFDVKNGVEDGINKQGFRDNVDFERIVYGNGKTRVMLLGDSFVYGYKLGKNGMLSSSMQRKLGEGYEIYNLGIPGWGIDQMYLAYKKYAPLIRPDIVVLVFIDEDIQRVFEAIRRDGDMNRPSFEIIHNELVLRKQQDPSFIEVLSQKSYLANEIYYHIYRNYYSCRIVKQIF